jgi:hypothetical protein
MPIEAAKTRNKMAIKRVEEKKEIILSMGIRKGSLKVSAKILKTSVSALQYILKLHKWYISILLNDCNGTPRE